MSHVMDFRRRWDASAITCWHSSSVMKSSMTSTNLFDLPKSPDKSVDLRERLGANPVRRHPRVLFVQNPMDLYVVLVLRLEGRGGRADRHSDPGRVIRKAVVGPASREAHVLRFGRVLRDTVDEFVLRPLPEQGHVVAP